MITPFDSLSVHNVALFYKDAEGRYLAINAPGADMLNCAPGDVVGKTDKLFFSEASAQLMLQRDHDIMHSARVRIYDSVARLDRWQRFLTVKMPMHSRLGTPIGLIGISALINGKVSSSVQNMLIEIRHEIDQNRAKFIRDYLEWVHQTSLQVQSSHLPRGVQRTQIPQLLSVFLSL